MFNFAMFRKNNSTRAYLAQHKLFDQIDELKNERGLWSSKILFSPESSENPVIKLGLVHKVNFSTYSNEEEEKQSKSKLRLSTKYIQTKTKNENENLKFKKKL